MVPVEGYLPDEDAIRADLAFMTRRWGELDRPCMFELRSFAPDTLPAWAQFTPARINEAAAWAVRQNANGRNVYVVRNPIRIDHKGSADDPSIIAAFFCWADCDDPESTDNVRKFEGPRWTAAVVTGKTPSTRVHLYWELEEPCLNLEAWRQMQVNIAAHFRSDRKVINSSRIMRVGGTISYPDPKKAAKGYVVEPCTIRTEYEDDRTPVEFERLHRVFGYSTPAPPHQTPKSFPIDVGTTAMDRALAAAKVQAGEDWHDNVVRLVASYVSRGLTDEEIHPITDGFTLEGWTVDETRREVQAAIDGARRKGWAPEIYATPNAVDFDAPPKSEEAKASPLEWFDDVEPALTDAYLVKGVLGAGAMSVIYGPSNSGKTFLALDIAFHVATATPWQGRRVTSAAVLYLAAEGGRGVTNRIAALKLETGVCCVPLALRRAGLDLLKSQADLQHIVDLVKELRSKHPDLPVLIVIDTLSRIMAGGDENSAQDMTALIRNIDAVREHTGAHVMLVHHTGKDTARGARGHSSLRAATDTEIEVQNEDGHRAAMVTKQRDYQGGEVFAFGLKNVSLGFDQDGDEVASCVVEWLDAEEFVAARKRTKGLGGNQKIIADTFDQMIAEGMGAPNPAGVGLPGPGRFLCVKIADLRRLAQGKMAASNPRSAFAEAWRALTDQRGMFCAASEMAWRVDRPIKGGGS